MKSLIYRVMILQWLGLTASLAKSGLRSLSAQLRTGKTVVDIRFTVILTQTITEVATMTMVVVGEVMTEVVMMGAVMMGVVIVVVEVID